MSLVFHNFLRCRLLVNPLTDVDRPSTRLANVLAVSLRANIQLNHVADSTNAVVESPTTSMTEPE